LVESVFGRAGPGAKARKLIEESHGLHRVVMGTVRARVACAELQTNLKDQRPYVTYVIHVRSQVLSRHAGTPAAYTYTGGDPDRNPDPDPDPNQACVSSLCNATCFMFYGSCFMLHQTTTHTL